MNQKRILVTGAGGFIGANLVRKIIEHDNKIYLIVKKDTNLWRIKDVLKKVTVIHDNLLDLSSLERIVKKIKPSIIYHLATYGDSSFDKDIKKIVETNIMGTLNLLLATKDIDYQIFINTGSSSEYGFYKKSMKEDQALNPNSFYSASKAGTTYLCSVFSKQFNKPIITFRPFSVYGPYEHKERFIPTIIKNLIKDQPIELTSGIVRRDFVFIDDVVKAYTKLTKLKKELYGEVFNLGTGIESSNGDVVKTLFEVTREKVPVKKGVYQNRNWDTSHWKADILKTKKLLSWKAKTNLPQGLKKTYEFINQNMSLYE